MELNKEQGRTDPPGLAICMEHIRIWLALYRFIYLGIILAFKRSSPIPMVSSENSYSIFTMFLNTFYISMSISKGSHRMGSFFILKNTLK